MFSCHAPKKTIPLRCLFPAGACPRRASPGRHLSSAPRAAARTHGRMLKVGAADDTYTWNTILTSYARWVGIVEARKLFDEMLARDAVTWNAMIAAEVSRGGHDGARSIFRAMLSSGLPFDQYTCGSVLKSVAGSGHLHLGRQFHCLIVKVGIDGNVFAGSALVDMYSKCGSMDDADLMFMLMPVRNKVSWNAVINGHVQAGDHAMAFHLFDQMEREGVGLDEATFASILTLLDRPAFFNLVLQIHGKIIKHGWAMDTIAYNAAITAYAQTGSTADALNIFLEMDGIRDLVTWNSMLAAYACDGLAGAAVKLFVEMQRLGIQQDMYTHTSVISACFEQEQHACGRALHSLAVKRGLDSRISVSNSLIAMYIKSDHSCCMEDAVRFFDVMDFRDSVSWNSILTGLSQSGLSEEAMKFFRRMQCTCLQIDHYALPAALRSCSDLAVLQLGRQVHSLLRKSGFSRNDFVVSSLIYMYSKSGVIDDARRAFDESHKDSSVTWNSIIFGYAQHGEGHIVLKLFYMMQELKVKPDHITFVAILSACSHIGLVEEGRKFLESMEPIYGIQLRMEHYACGVDLFGRSGHLEEAKKLIDSMPFEPDATVWKPLLGACRIHRDMELGSVVARQLLLLEPEEHSTYVILSNMYAASGRWSDRALIQRTMKEGKIRKVPGWSWIEVKNEVHAFNAEDRDHSEVEEIYEKVEELMDVISMMDAGEDFESTFSFSGCDLLL